MVLNRVVLRRSAGGASSTPSAASRISLELPELQSLERTNYKQIIEILQYVINFILNLNYS